MKDKKNRQVQRAIIINSLFVSIIFLLYFLFILKFDTLSLIKFLVLFHAFTIFLLAYIDYGFFSVYSIFLFCSAFFIYDSLFFDLINYPGRENFAEIYFPGIHEFSDEVAILFLLYTCIFVFILDTVYRICVLNNKQKKLFYEVDYKSIFISKVVIIGMIILLPISVYKLYRIMIYMRRVGYVKTILNGIPDGVYPNWTNGIAGVIYSLFLIIIIIPVNKKTYIIASILYLVNCMLKGFSGNRGSFLYPLFAIIIVYLSYFSSKKIKIKYILMLGLISIIFSIFIGNTRNNTKNQNIKKENLICDFLISQTNSRAIPLIIIDGNIPYHNYPFIFQPLLKNKYNNIKDRYEKIKKTNSIDYLTSFKINRKRTLNGAGLGGAIIGEFIDCGKWFGVIFWTIILAIMIEVLDSINTKKRIYRPLLFIMIVNMVHNPRGYFFKFINDIEYVIFGLFIYLLISFLYDHCLRGAKQCKIK